MLDLCKLASWTAAQSLGKGGVAALGRRVEVFALERGDVGPEDGWGDYPTGRAPLKRVCAPVARVNMDSQEIRVDTHIWG